MNIDYFEAIIEILFGFCGICVWIWVFKNRKKVAKLEKQMQFGLLSESIQEKIILISTPFTILILLILLIDGFLKIIRG